VFGRADGLELEIHLDLAVVGVEIVERIARSGSRQR
jgi:hypothetical protein